MGAKQLETLPQDIYELFNPDVEHIPSDENLNIFCDDLKELLRARLSKYVPPTNPLRFSALGKPDRQVWYDAHPIEGGKERLVPKTYIKFLYGDIIEGLILFLAKEAGHSVTHTQEEIDVDGVKGHIDAIVDGVVVDVKSASPFGYKKFEDELILDNDPFGYVAQLSGYASELTPDKDAAWIANDKVGGDICVTRLQESVIKQNLPAPRIAHLRKIIDNETPPNRCYEDMPDGKSGNRKLSTPCSYCPHKYRCWDNLRCFIYSTGPRYLTNVAREPDVFETASPAGEDYES